MYYDERDNHLKIKDESQEINNYEFQNKELNKYENKELNSFENNFTTNDIKKWDNDIKFDINNININNFRKNESIELYSANEGLNKGNMFKNEYDPYKNYIYKVVVKGERDELLLKIQELTFKTIDLNLYLDMYPNDDKCYQEFKSTVKDLKKYKELYEKNYGPLCMTDTLFYDSYKWEKNPWPWMNEGGQR